MSKQRKRRIFTALVTFSMVVLSFVGYVEAKSNARPLPTEPPLITPMSIAPGYCTSNGGSTDFESLSSVTLTPKPSGIYDLEVQVFIANPGGCVPGQPCPAYDDSPEYVNVWIDWNGDNTWDNSERVMDKALTGYSSINYGGTMTAKVQFSPSAVTGNPTWLRANLGWDHDPNNPCETSWTWGDVLDKQEQFKVPEIKDITAKGIGTHGDNPQTGKFVRLEANLEIPTGYEITKCKWEGDLYPSPIFGDTANNCRGDYTPDANAGPSVKTYGDKTVTLTVTYKHSTSVATGTSFKKHNYNVFFEKKGDDNTNGKPNWFEYWGINGAVPGLNAPSVRYEASYGSRQYGSWNWASKIIKLGKDAAETHSPTKKDNGNVPVKAHCPGGSFGGAQGIDTVAEVLAHERKHEELWDNWNSPGRIWHYLVNIDTDDPTPGDKGMHNLKGDMLPDTYENNISNTDPNNLDSCDLKNLKHPMYMLNGDEEFVCLQAGFGQKGVASNDWANPGKQLPVSSFFTPLDTVSLGSMDNKSMSSGAAHALYSDGFLWPDFGKLVGNYSETGIDTDGDALYNSLKLSIDVEIQESSSYNLVAWLEDGLGTPIVWASTEVTLDVGFHTVVLLFDGLIIRDSERDGPYNIARVELRVGDEGDLGDVVDNAYTTANYQYTDFDSPIVSLTENFSDTVIDTDGDGLYNLLRFNVGLEVQEAGTYTVMGSLDSSESTNGTVRHEVQLLTGSQNINLDFDGQQIFQDRKNGPYYLRRLRVEDAADKKLDFINEAYTTEAYTYTQFQHGNVTINADSYRDHGLDIDKDGDFDYLRVEVDLNNAGQGGHYRVFADLVDSNGKTVGDKELSFSMTAGNPFTVTLDFLGSDIFQQGVNGPYQVSRVSFMDLETDVRDYQQTAHTTQAYSYTDFGPPLVSLTGNYQDYGQDTDTDGFYDSLVIEIGVLPDNNGLIVATGRLGHELKWVTNSVEMTGGSEQQISLAFDGKLIRANKVNGPYELRDIMLYQTGDPNQKIFESLAHTTNAYSYEDFSASGSVLQFSAAGYSVDEDDGSATITVIRSGDGQGEVSVDCATSNGTATNDDYITTLETLTWLDGENGTNTDCTVPIIDDNENEGAETVILTLSNPTGGALLGNPKVATLTIADVLLVTLIDNSFTATRSNGGVSLKWETGTERKNAGFFVLRGQLPTGKTECSDKSESYTEVRRISTLLPAQGSDMSGAIYSYEDSQVKHGNTYCYALEDVELSGKRTLHLEDIVSVTVE